MSSAEPFLENGCKIFEIRKANKEEDRLKDERESAIASRDKKIKSGEEELSSKNPGAEC